MTLSRSDRPSTALLCPAGCADGQIILDEFTSHGPHSVSEDCPTCAGTGGRLCYDVELDAARCGTWAVTAEGDGYCAYHRDHCSKCGARFLSFDDGAEILCPLCDVRFIALQGSAVRVEAAPVAPIEEPAE